MSKEVHENSESKDVKESKQESESYTSDEKERVQSASDRIRSSWYTDGENDNSKNMVESTKDKSYNKEVDYSRPTHWRSGMRDEVWNDAKDDHGRVRDPVSGIYMSKDQPWHMGHKPGYEFYKHQRSARERGISREEFLDEYYNSKHYRPELPKSNMSHKGEDVTDEYFGD